LGLQPLALDLWLTSPPSQTELANKQKYLAERYADVVQVAAPSDALDRVLSDLPVPCPVAAQFPDRIADVALSVADDLCVIDVGDAQRLVAACVCAPSYWRLLDKIGLPLGKIHDPVPQLNAKIGDNIARFVANAPMGQPFARSNWFLHNDNTLFHDNNQETLVKPVADWFVRSEQQTLCRLSGQYLLFTIRIVCEPLRHIEYFPQAQGDLLKSLAGLDEDEIEHFGGLAKWRKLTDYVESLS
jgi:hypothetical protein